MNLSAPEKAVKNADRSGEARIEIAASCNPEIQPSVRLSSAVTSSAERPSPITWLRKWLASSDVKRRSAW